MHCESTWRFRLFGVLFVGVLTGQPAIGQTPKVSQALTYSPIQSDVEYDRPTQAEIAACTMEELVSGGDVTGWIVRDEAGQMLRRFVDTNKDNSVDTWSYYRNGVEVYRDIDGNHDGKADQYRWLGSAGVRWGIDDDQNEKIDSWKAISAEEVSAEVVAALRNSDADRFKRLLLTKDDLDSLQLDEEKTKLLRERLDKATQGIAALAKSQRYVSAQSKWVHFGAMRPGVVPAGVNGATKDLIVYENVAAVMSTAGKHGQVQIGTMIQVGQTWRLIDLPSGIIEGQPIASTEAGFFFQTALERRPEAAASFSGGLSERSQQLIDELEQIDRKIGSSPSASGQHTLNKQRADLLAELAEAASDDESHQIWIEQLADTVSSAIQAGAYPDGSDRLKTLYESLATDDPQGNLTGYVKFRWLSAQYVQSLQDPKGDLAKVQDQWSKDLEGFVGDFPKSADASEAMSQLALAGEFAGEDQTALKWYARIVKEFPKSSAAPKAKGARRRLESVGKSLQIQGTTLAGKRMNLTAYKGRVVAIHYWATWCEPCKEDMKVLRQLTTKYGKQGFLPLGVNLDLPEQKKEAANFVKKSRLPWPHLHESGGLDGRLANEMGIMTLPTMILVDKKGRVVNRGVHIGQLEDELKKYLK